MDILKKERLSCSLEQVILFKHSLIFPPNSGDLLSNEKAL